MLNQHTPTPANQQEEWRPASFPDCPYEVSSLGRVRRIGGAPLKYIMTVHGYANVGVRTAGGFLSVRVHRLVALTFLGPRPDGAVINHIDGDKCNNRATNLEYVTLSENALHSTRVLGKKRGSSHNMVRYDEATILEVRRLYATGEWALIELAHRFGISKGHVRQIVQRKNWNHLPEDTAPRCEPKRLHGLKGFCAKGHELNSENAYFRKDGRVAYCKICTAARRKAARANRRRDE